MTAADPLFEKMQRALEDIIRSEKVTTREQLIGIMVKSAQCGLIAMASTDGRMAAIEVSKVLTRWLESQRDDSFPKVEFIRNSAVIPASKTLQ